MNFVIGRRGSIQRRHGVSNVGFVPSLKSTAFALGGGTISRIWVTTSELFFDPLAQARVWRFTCSISTQRSVRCNEHKPTTQSTQETYDIRRQFQMSLKSLKLSAVISQSKRHTNEEQNEGEMILILMGMLTSRAV